MGVPGIANIESTKTIKTERRSGDVVRTYSLHHGQDIDGKRWSFWSWSDLKGDQVYSSPYYGFAPLPPTEMQVLRDALKPFELIYSDFLQNWLGMDQDGFLTFLKAQPTEKTDLLEGFFEAAWDALSSHAAHRQPPQAAD